MTVSELRYRVAPKTMKIKGEKERGGFGVTMIRFYNVCVSFRPDSPALSIGCWTKQVRDTLGSLNDPRTTLK